MTDQPKRGSRTLIIAIVVLLGICMLAVLAAVFVIIPPVQRAMATVACMGSRHDVTDGDQRQALCEEWLTVATRDHPGEMSTCLNQYGLNASDSEALSGCFISKGIDSQSLLGR